MWMMKWRKLKKTDSSDVYQYVGLVNFENSILEKGEKNWTKGLCFSIQQNLLCWEKYKKGDTSHTNCVFRTIKHLISWQSRDSISTVAPACSLGFSNRTEWHHTVEIEPRDCQDKRAATVLKINCGKKSYTAQAVIEFFFAFLQGNRSSVHHWFPHLTYLYFLESIHHKNSLTNEWTDQLITFFMIDFIRSPNLFFSFSSPDVIDE